MPLSQACGNVGEKNNMKLRICLFSVWLLLSFCSAAPHLKVILTKITNNMPYALSVAELEVLSCGQDETSLVLYDSECDAQHAVNSPFRPSIPIVRLEEEACCLGTLRCSAQLYPEGAVRVYMENVLGKCVIEEFQSFGVLAYDTTVHVELTLDGEALTNSRATIAFADVSLQRSPSLPPSCASPRSLGDRVSCATAVSSYALTSGTENTEGGSDDGI